LVAKSEALNDLERPLPTLLQNKLFLRTQHENLNNNISGKNVAL